MDGSLPELLWQTKETVHRRTGPRHAWPYETLSDRMWCFKICFWSSTHPTGLKWRPTPLCLHFKNILAHWKKLQNLRSRIVSDHLSTGRMATLHSRVPTHNGHLLQPQEFDLLLRSKKTEQKASTMVALPVWIQRQTYPHFGKQNDPIRCALSKTGLHTQGGQQQWGHHNVAQEPVHQPDWFGPPKTYC